ncbi:binding-protein-dependent transport systems inner membrane component [Rubrobacter xylanophilus DSM 9941]|uniref:Binding-protein-dependent transport systems inner membrane component n=1 Tax=Rubrobacter xylanophilus (strain DSM 9941 / JCM 11954 / NBRC 16129 / PRD-1) TaxID=266117 RepID=Q1ASX7_RUBXD|nr:proline/glycine betaine ABC transporter permease [Rubrobacter xylanophilus]ABG05501.1 binding-protein-dependent transport systems inner membrane component [Rubrobacter xylanophilus DSM 9941]
MLGFLLQQVPEIPLEGWVESFVDFITSETFEGFFDALEGFLNLLVDVLEAGLTFLPPLVMVAVFAGLAWLVSSWRIALLTAAGLLLLQGLRLWEDAMLTLALVIAATAVALVVGIPLGIVAAKSRGVETVLRPVLDFMQTMPAFVYLVPAIVLLGLGAAPALVAVVIFAMPPAVRLTMLGLQQVSKETVEAASAFGATGWQTLRKVELPLAMPTIMAGVNQVIMLSLSMVVIAALIGAGGLGEEVYQGLSQLDVGKSFKGGLGIVIIAILLDRITRNIRGGGAQKAGSGIKTA